MFSPAKEKQKKKTFSYAALYYGLFCIGVLCILLFEMLENLMICLFLETIVSFCNKVTLI